MASSGSGAGAAGAIPPPPTTIAGGHAPAIPLRAGAAGTRIKTTRPKAILRHEISDEQLQMLSDLKREGLYELAWAAVGGALGALLPAAEALWKAYWVQPSTPLTIIGLLTVVVLFVCIAAAVVSFVVAKNRGKGAKSLVEQIRKQPAS